MNPRGTATPFSSDSFPILKSLKNLSINKKPQNY